MENPITLNTKRVGETVSEITKILQSHDLFYGHGMPSPGDEAAYLVSFVAGLPPDFGIEANNISLTPSYLSEIENILNQRVYSRTPLAYLLGETWLSGSKFIVNEHVLIPRSPIAEMIENQFFPWWSQTEAEWVLDLCTGSGCLGILAAKRFSSAKVDVSDVDLRALEVAEQNIVKHELENRVTAVYSDVYQQLPGHQYDIIMANPPYVPQCEQPDLPREYLYEPEHALFAGEDGLDIAKRILADATKYLNRNGILVMEVGQSANKLQACFPQFNFMWQELERGGEGVCVLSYEECQQFSQ